MAQRRWPAAAAAAPGGGLHPGARTCAISIGPKARGATWARRAAGRRAAGRARLAGRQGAARAAAANMATKTGKQLELTTKERGPGRRPHALREGAQHAHDTAPMAAGAAFGRLQRAIRHAARVDGMLEVEAAPMAAPGSERREKRRNLAAFWLLGLLNNSGVHYDAIESIGRALCCSWCTRHCRRCLPPPLSPMLNCICCPTCPRCAQPTWSCWQARIAFQRRRWAWCIWRRWGRRCCARPGEDTCRVHFRARSLHLGADEACDAAPVNNAAVCHWCPTASAVHAGCTRRSARHAPLLPLLLQRSLLVPPGAIPHPHASGGTPDGSQLHHRCCCPAGMGHPARETVCAVRATHLQHATVPCNSLDGGPPHAAIPASKCASHPPLVLHWCVLF